MFVLCNRNISKSMSILLDFESDPKTNQEAMESCNVKIRKSFKLLTKQRHVLCRDVSHKHVLEVLLSQVFINDESS